MDIVCFPDMEWDHGLWTNRQHIMSRLPAVVSGTRVLYVSPPRFIATGIGPRTAQRLSEGGTRARLHTPSKGLWVLQLLLPVPNKLARRFAPGLLDRFTLSMTRRAMRKLDFDAPILWSYTPIGVPKPHEIGAKLFVYDVVDDYSALAHYRRLVGPEVARLDNQSTTAADVVFVTSSYLEEQRRQVTSRVVAVPNAADVDLFAQARASGPSWPADLPSGKKIVGFHGSLTSEKVDSRMIVDIAQRRPEWDFVLIGPTTDAGTADVLAEAPNVHRLGSKPQAALPSYLARFDAALVPYLRNDYTMGVNALKIVECLAAGVPVVATDLPGSRMHEERIRLIEGVDSAVVELDKIMLAPPPPVPLESLADLSWEAKARYQMSAVAKALSP